MNTMIPIAEPAIGPESEALVLEVLRSGNLSQGVMVERFEHQVARMAGVEHAIAVSNGTVALEAALAVLGVGPGDEVITSPLTFVATLNAILRSGAKAVFADVTDDLTIDPEAVAERITSRTKVIMPVHLYGLMADMVRLSEIARQHDLAIIEDAAQAHGAEQSGHKAGSFGLGCFSFYATKNVTSGEGGMVTTNSDQLASELRVLRNQGQRARYDYVMVGQNLRMTDVAAAIAIPQMEKLKEIRAARARNAAKLTELLQEVVTCLPLAGDRVHAWHHFTVLLAASSDRTAVISAMAERGVACGAYYPRMVWDYPAFSGMPNIDVGHTPKARDFAARCLSLPVHPRLSGSDVDRVARVVRATVAAFVHS